MTSDNNIAVPEAQDNPTYVRDAQDLPFFIVHRIGPDLALKQREDYFRHATFKLAQKEARRLAAKFPGNRFVVLQACTWFMVKKKPAPEGGC